jgi:2-polyprenyl-3-methyl-5-hydroxy-6-metoxy-1,4-benzoquinol methylase
MAIKQNLVCCWICGSTQQKLIRKSTLDKPLSSNLFKITDAHYGQTGNIYQCVQCGFKQCNDLREVLTFYQSLDDEAYEENRVERAKQARRILQAITLPSPPKRLLDIGAGSGILVEEAQKLGYKAEGIEPSKWLCDKAAERALSVHHGTLPHFDVKPPYDIVSLIDVIEHVPDPVDLLKKINQIMTDDGIGIIVTPDVNALAARLMGYRWWHYRIAHIGFFNRATLELALEKAGFRPLQVSRPWWYFSLSYLLERINVYLPRWFQIPLFRWTESIAIPLNLFDSLLMTFTKK